MRTVSRALSAAVALGYLALGYWIGGPYTVIQTAVFLLFPMAAIWFSEELGSLTGNIRLQFIDRTSPGLLVAIFGWLLLLPVIGVFISRLVS
jgi:hypothetical protein